jgi:hypothetical protein
VSQSDAETMRGSFRRYALAHTIMWALLMLVLALLFARNADWSRSWVFLPMALPALLLAPGFVKFYRLSAQAGYSRGWAVQKYLLGASKAEIQAVLTARAEHEVAWDQLVKQVLAFEPQLHDRVLVLRRQNKLDEATSLFGRAKQERSRVAEQQARRTESLRADSSRLHCSGIVEPLLATGAFDEADSVVMQVRGLLEEAHSLGIREEVLKLLDCDTRADLGAAKALLATVRRAREKSRFFEELKRRIQAVPQQSRPELQRLLEGLAECSYDSRGFRIAWHELDVAIRRAEGVR